MFSYIEAFNKAVNLKLILKEDTSIISNDLDKFKKFRELTNEKTQFDLLMMNYLKCENIVPLAGKIFNLLINKKSIDIERISKVTSHEILSIIPNNENLIKLINILINRNTSISIKKSNSNFETIEFLNNYRFNVEFPIQLEDKNYNNVKFFIADAYIDEVSQIQNILQKSYNNNDVLVICSRGYSNDVLNTFCVNNNRNTLKVIPCLVKVEYGSLNDMFDIGMVTGCEIISSTKGQLLSGVDYEQLPYVEFVKIEMGKNTLNIKNDKRKFLIENHVRKLKEKTVDFHLETQWLARINNLNSKSCIVSLKKDGNYEFRKSEIIKYYKLFDSYMKYGKVETNYGIFPYQSYVIANKIYEEYQKVTNERIYYSYNEFSEKDYFANSE
jgi:chaperonin GroEL (HSP60 family)